MEDELSEFTCNLIVRCTLLVERYQCGVLSSCLYNLCMFVDVCCIAVYWYMYSTLEYVHVRVVDVNS